MSTTMCLAGILVVAMSGLSDAGGAPAASAPWLLVWGAAHAAMFVACQVRVMLAGAYAQAFALPLNISACNVGIGAGAVAGAWVVDALGIAYVGYASSVLAIAGMLVATLIAVLTRRSWLEECTRR